VDQAHPRTDIVLSNCPKPRTIAAVKLSALFSSLAKRSRGWLSQACFICGMKSRDGLLCGGCLDELPALPIEHCPQCAVPAAGGQYCGACLTHSPHYDATRAAFEYRFPLEPMVIALKYHAQLPIAPFLARMMMEAIEPVEADCIIPLPLHPKRLAERGFNQSAEIARCISRGWGIPMMLDACERDRYTQPQASLTGSDRHGNVRGAFRGTRDLAGLHVVVVDDVMTTGSTLDEVARVLKARGASRVTNLVAARTLPNFGSR